MNGCHLSYITKIKEKTLPRPWTSEIISIRETLFYFILFLFLSILCCSQSAKDPSSQIWLQAKYEIKIFKTSFYIFSYLLEPCIENLQFFFFSF
jgi:hypothetical protein